MGKYTEVKSKFIKEKIKKADWKKDKGYIDDLVFLEKSILKGINGYGANIVLFNVKEKSKEDYYKILKELNPKRFKQEMKQNNKEIRGYLKFIKDFNKKEIGELKRGKEDWIKAGGKK